MLFDYQPSTKNHQLVQRRAQSNRYPDLGFKPHSAFPLPVALEFVAVTVAQPSRILTGFPDIRLLWAELLPPVSKNPPVLRRIKIFPSKIFAARKTCFTPPAFA
jgi:hypothetical protein